MSAGAYVTLDAVTRQWQGRGGVTDISMAVAEGQFVSILGPSGCGKSTLLRLVSGLEAPDRGTVHIAGREVTGLPASQRGLSMVFQSYALFPHLSVRENILFGMRVRRVRRPEREAKLAEADHVVTDARPGAPFAALLDGLEGRLIIAGEET